MRVMNSMPEKALLLAAGFGKRLQPLTSAMPKPLIPLWNRPLIGHIITMLKLWGVKEIVVNTHWQSDKLEDHFKQTDYGIKIHLSPESEIRGTGGALAPWRSFFADEPFWVVNGDIAASLNCQPIIEAFDSIPGLAGACWVTDNSGPRTVELDYAGRITCYRSPEPGIAGTYTFCGAQLLSPAIFDFIPEEKFSTLVDAYESAMFSNLFIKGVNIPGSYWNDAGTLQRYCEIHMETKRRSLSGKAGGELYNPLADVQRDRRKGFFCVGNGVKIPADIKADKSIVFDGVTLNEGTSLKNAVVQGGAVNGKLHDLCCVSGCTLSDQRIKDAAASLGWDEGESSFSFIGSRGSDRSFWRGFNGTQRAVFIVDGGERIENLRYPGHTELLQKAGLPVPEIFHVSPDRKTIVLEDAGESSLTDKMSFAPEKAEKLYSSILTKVALFHRRVTQLVKSEGVDLEPEFDLKLYHWEHCLFEENLLKQRFGYESLPDDVRAELTAVASELDKGSRVVIHRDLQSSNILFKGRHYAFIDYQGMRIGSPAYDIASLLYDPYVNIDPELRCRLAAGYLKIMPECPDVVDLFFKGAVQRLIQTLGAFGRLSSLGHSSFEEHIFPGLENLLEAADAADLDATGGMVEELIAREGMRTKLRLRSTGKRQPIFFERPITNEPNLPR